MTLTQILRQALDRVSDISLAFDANGNLIGILFKC